MVKRKIVFRRIGYRLLALAIVLIAAAAVRYHTRPTVDRYVFYVEIPRPLETEVGDRDISKYEFGGRVVSCNQEGDEEKCFKDYEEIRDFIESRFRNHRLGYVIVDWVGADVMRTQYFFIEPDKFGNWEIRVREQLPEPYTRFYINMNTTYFSEVFRRRIPKGHSNLKPEGSVLVLRSRGVYELLL